MKPLKLLLIMTAVWLLLLPSGTHAADLLSVTDERDGSGSARDGTLHVFTLSDLDAMEQYMFDYTFIDDDGTLWIEHAMGVLLADVLESAGVPLEKVETIRFLTEDPEAGDVVWSKEELLDTPRYCNYSLLDYYDPETGEIREYRRWSREPVGTMLAIRDLWQPADAEENGEDLSEDLREVNRFRLVFGQSEKLERNASRSVGQIYAIEIEYGETVPDVKTTAAVAPESGNERTDSEGRPEVDEDDSALKAPEAEDDADVETGGEEPPESAMDADRAADSKTDQNEEPGSSAAQPFGGASSGKTKPAPAPDIEEMSARAAAPVSTAPGKQVSAASGVEKETAFASEPETEPSAAPEDTSESGYIPVSEIPGTYPADVQKDDSETDKLSRQAVGRTIKYSFAPGIWIGGIVLGFVLLVLLVILTGYRKRRSLRAVWKKRVPATDLHNRGEYGLSAQRKDR